MENAASEYADGIGHRGNAVETDLGGKGVELIRNRGPWHDIDDLELAVAEHIDWFNNRRLHGNGHAEASTRPGLDIRQDPTPGLSSIRTSSA